MGELTFQVILLRSTSTSEIKPVLWRNDGNTGGFSSFGEKVKEFAVEYVNEEIDTTEWEGFFAENVGDSEVARLGTITVDDTKTVVDDGFFRSPSDGVEVQDYPIGF